MFSKVDNKQQSDDKNIITFDDKTGLENYTMNVDRTIYIKDNKLVEKLLNNELDITNEKQIKIQSVNIADNKILQNEKYKYFIQTLRDQSRRY
jgi:hypothetical protein